MDNFVFDVDSSGSDADTHISGDEKEVEGEGYMAVTKEGVSTQEHEMSSGVHEDAFSFGSPGDGSLGGGWVFMS